MSSCILQKWCIWQAGPLRSSQRIFLSLYHWFSPTSSIFCWRSSLIFSKKIGRYHWGCSYESWIIKRFSWTEICNVWICIYASCSFMPWLEGKIWWTIHSNYNPTVSSNILWLSPIHTKINPSSSEMENNPVSSRRISSSLLWILFCWTIENPEYNIFTSSR